MTAPAMPLYGYQRRFVADASPRRVLLWCRDAGKGAAVAIAIAIMVAEAEAAGSPVEWYLLSSRAGSTQQNLRYIAKAMETLSLSFGLLDEELEPGDGTRVAVQKITCAGGSQIRCLPTNHLTLRGAHGNLWWDEAGHTPNAEEIWRAAAPIASRVGRKIIVSGTAGDEKSGPFWRMLSGDLPGWSIHTVDVYAAIRDGAPIDLEQVRATVGRGEAFDREYLNVWGSGQSRLIQIDEIAACESPDTLVVPAVVIDVETEADWLGLLDAQPDDESPISEGYDQPKAWARLFAPLGALDGDLYLGYDVARRRHYASLHVVEIDGWYARLRAIVAFMRRRYAEQEAAILAALEHCRRGAIDATGQGDGPAERVQERNGRAEPVKFSEVVKEDLAMRVARRFADRTIRVPYNPRLRDAIHAVRRTVTKANHVRFDAAATEASGHADDFWALGLALYAAGDHAAAAPFFYSEGAPRFSRAGACI